MAKILIIDDDIQLHQLVGRFLIRHGHDVKTASNGGQGLICATGFSPDLILCDLNMPGIDGQGVVASLRESEILGEIPVIFLSGCSERKQIRRSMNLGGDDFITKPADLSEILEAIDARLTRLGKQRQRIARHWDRAADLIAGIINNLGPSKSAIKWWSEAGVGKGQLPDPIMNRVQGLLDKQQRGDYATTSTPANSSTVLVKDENRQQYLQLSEVKAIVAEGEYSTLCWGNNRHVMFRKPLKQWEQELPQELFVRVHRSAIINLAFLDYVERDVFGKQKIHLQGFKPVITVSQRAMSAFNRSLKKFRPMKKT